MDKKEDLLFIIQGLNNKTPLMEVFYVENYY